VTGPDDAGRERLRRYFEDGFRDLFLTEVRNANDRDLRMGTFLLAAAFIDALALTHAGHTKDMNKSWSAFVKRYFKQPDYATLTTLYGGYRSRALHNFSSAKIAFIHNNPRVHLQTFSGRVHLNRENFVADVEAAFYAFYADVQRQPSLAASALKHLDKYPPLTVIPVEPSGTPILSLNVSAASSATPSND
jgi:hypothetical protein